MGHGTVLITPNLRRHTRKKIRAHYAGLVKQIDYEMGQILDALREKELLDNTIIIFSSDHGDYLGDHDFIGKGTFFESSIHVPLIGSPAADSTNQRHAQI